MDIELGPGEARVIGCLIEKEITTPDHYPLSLNALTGACNQKSNRDPVMALSESEVQDLVDGLVKRYLVSDKAGFGGRVTKYKHRFCNTEFGDLKFSPQELGIVCVLLLRGPQTPGELRGRTHRLCSFADVHEAEAALDGLMTREDGPFVTRLAREPGKRESRYAHLLSGEVEADVERVEQASPAVVHAPEDDRLTRLEERVRDLREEVDELRRRVDQHRHDE